MAFCHRRNVWNKCDGSYFSRHEIYHPLVDNDISLKKAERSRFCIAVVKLLKDVVSSVAQCSPLRELELDLESVQIVVVK